MPPTPSPSQWWVFLPFSRLHIQDQSNSLAKPLFDDVTLISAETLLHVFKETFKQHEETKRTSDENWFSSITKAETYLAVRRRGIVNTQWFMEDRKNEKFVGEIRQRAAKISALFTIAFLATSTEGHVCGLSDQFRRTNEQMAILEIGPTPKGLVTESFGSSIRTFILDNTDDLFFSREGLLSVLDQPQLRGLSQIMIAQKPNIAKSLYTSTNQACVRLANAIFSNSYTEQLLGAITCIELLLTNENQATGYANINRRLAMLVGENVLEKYEFEKLLNARHSYVHRGEEVQVRKYPLQIISIAIYALLLYANVANQFKRKDSLLTYLDILYLSERLEGLGENQNYEIADNLLKQLRKDDKPLIFKFVDDAIEFDLESEMGLYDRYDRVFVDGGDDFT